MNGILAVMLGAVAAQHPPVTDFTVAPERVAEARQLLPAPLLYGTFRPVLGEWVEYRLQPGDTKVRVAATGRSESEGTVRWQVEFAFETKPKTIVALTIIETPAGAASRPFVERLAAVAEPQPPVSIPVDLFADAPELRGEVRARAKTSLRGGPFAGPAETVRYVLAGAASEATITDRVPLFGIARVRADGVTWTATKSGDDATPAMTQVPLIVPRLPESIPDVH